MRSCIRVSRRSGVEQTALGTTSRRERTRAQVAEQGTATAVDRGGWDSAVGGGPLSRDSMPAHLSAALTARSRRHCVRTQRKKKGSMTPQSVAPTVRGGRHCAGRCVAEAHGVYTKPVLRLMPGAVDSACKRPWRGALSSMQTDTASGSNCSLGLGQSRRGQDF